MRYSQKIIDSATALRQKGLTFGEINQKLRVNIPKSTLSGFFKGLALNKSAKQRLKQSSLESLATRRLLALKVNKKKLAIRISLIRQQAAEAVESRQTDKIALSMLYLGEGSKRRSYRGLSLGNTDPTVLRIYIGFLRRCYGIEKKKLRFRILYRADQDLGSLTRYWCEQLGCLTNQFYKTTYDKRTINKPTNNKEYMGVCVVTCGGADIQLELSFIAQLLSDSFTRK